MMVIESDEDLEIAMLKREASLGGNIYEEKYSFWARLIPDRLELKYNRLRQKSFGSLNGDDLGLLLEMASIFRFAYLQGLHDEGKISKKEEIEYLKLRTNMPLDELRLSKLSDEEVCEVNELLESGSVSELKEKGDLSLAERCALEIGEHRSFVSSMRQMNKSLSYRLRQIDARNSSSYDIAKHTIMR